MNNRIRQLREELHLTLLDLSEQLKTRTNLKLSPDAIAKYERGDREPKLETWKELADFFNVSIPYLQGIESSISSSDLCNYLYNEYIEDSGDFFELEEFKKNHKIVTPNLDLIKKVLNSQNFSNDTDITAMTEWKSAQLEFKNLVDPFLPSIKNTLKQLNIDSESELYNFDISQQMLIDKAISSNIKIHNDIEYMQKFHSNSPDEKYFKEYFEIEDLADSLNLDKLVDNDSKFKQLNALEALIYVQEMIYRLNKTELKLKKIIQDSGQQ